MFAVALVLPLAYGMNPATAIILLAAVHAACAYGDSFASILINTPGGVGSVASRWAGHPMAQKGKAGGAMGIPGSSTTAIFLAAMIMHGLQPGVQFLEKLGALPYTVFVGILLAQFSFFLIGLSFARHFAKAVLIPNALLVPLIVMLSFLASIAMRGFVEDVLITFVFGFIGYLLNRYRYPTACLVLGLVLGELVEANFHRALLIGRGSYAVFVTRPISLILFLLTIGALLWPDLKPLVIRRREEDDLKDEESALT